MTSRYASAKPATTPEDRPEQADDESLEAQRALDLLRRRADRRQDGQLAEALRHDDAERVVDHERADEERQRGERLEADLEDLAESARLGTLVLEELVAGLDLEAVGNEWFDRGDQVRLADVAAEVQVLVGDDAGVQPVERRGLRHRDGAVLVDGVGAPERRDAHDGRVELAGGGEHDDLVADGEALVLGEPVVDGDLAGGARRGAFDDVDVVELVVVDPQPTGGAVRERLAVVAEEGDRCAQFTGHRVDLGERRDLIGHFTADAKVIGELRTRALVVGDDRRLDAGELAVHVTFERIDHPVGEEAGGGEERHAGDDGDQRGDVAPAVVAHTAQCKLDHVGSALEPLHAVEDPVGGRVRHLVDDLAVGEEQHAVRRTTRRGGRG